MRVGVVWRQEDIPSLATYRDALVPRLLSHGVATSRVDPATPAPPELDLLWDPGLGLRSPPPTAVAWRGPLVMTVHGLQPFSVPPWRLAGPRRWPFWAELSRRTWMGWRRLHRPYAVTVSEYGAREARRVHRLSHDRVTAIPHGVDHERFTSTGPVDEAAAAGRPYFLHLSHAQGVKNARRIVAAWRRLRRRDSACPDLVLAGAGHRDYPDPGVHALGHVPATRLAPLYRGAVAFVFPSHYESFGMPIVEAMACGVPVITSDGTGCRETAGDAALLVNPRSTTALARAMTEVTQPDVAATLVANGKRRAAQFDWDASARAHAAWFRRVQAAHEATARQ